jgi:Arc/MetJ-type ribon-helix-helix transcriptional regulator
MCNQAFFWLTRLAWQPLQSVKRPKSCDGSAFWLTPIWFVMIDPEGKGPPVPQGKPHSVDLTPDLENAIQRRLDSGAYKSAVEVIRAGLRTIATTRKGLAGWLNSTPPLRAVSLMRTRAVFTPPTRSLGEAQK